MDNQDYNQSQVAPDNNLVWAILVTILCCLPAGIYAIIRSSKVNALWAAGQFDEAKKAADDAKKWSIYGAIAGVVVGVLYFIIFGAMAVAGSGAFGH